MARLRFGWLVLVLSVVGSACGEDDAPVDDSPVDGDAGSLDAPRSERDAADVPDGAPPGDASGDAAGDADSGSRCDGGVGLVLCGATCINPSNDPKHCGGCNRPCNDDERCQDSECRPVCRIGGTTVVEGALNPANPCSVCDPARSTTQWSPRSNGTACAAGKICANGACDTRCFIDGTLRANGTINPDNACEQCTPASSTSDWSPRPNGTTCAGSNVCEAGVCNAKCFINGTFYTANATNPANACQQCNPAKSSTTWTTRADGTSCGSGLICQAATCSAKCYIGGTFYAANATKPADTCDHCNPAASTTAWSRRDTVRLLVGGSDPQKQGWKLVASTTGSSLTWSGNETILRTSTPAGATKSGYQLLYYERAYPPGSPFKIRFEVLVETVAPHNFLDSAAALLGTFTPGVPTNEEREQSVFLDSATIGWADNTQSAPTNTNVFHTYELSAAGDPRVATLSVDGTARLTREYYEGWGTIALGDETFDPNVDGTMRIRSVTRVCKVTP